VDAQTRVLSVTVFWSKSPFIYRVGQKVRSQTHGHNSIIIFTDAQSFFTGRFLGKFAVKSLLEIPLHFAYVATLPCETLMSEYKRLTIKYKVV